MIVFLLLGLVACKEKTEEPEPVIDEDKIVTPEKLECSHSYDVLNDEVNPYLVIKGLPYDSDTIDYSIIVFLNFPKNFKNNVLTKRFYNYLQCDYYAGEEMTTYYHIFDHSDDDGGHLSNAIKFVPRYNTSKEVTKICFDLKYEYELDGVHLDKEVKFEENILCFDNSKFIDIIENDNYHFDIIITKKENEDYNRYKLVIDLDDNNSGHYDIQTWLLIDGKVIPFIGYYHYRTINDDITSVSDEKINVDRNVSSVYYMVRFYDDNGSVTDIYYQQRLD